MNVPRTFTENIRSNLFAACATFSIITGSSLLGTVASSSIAVCLLLAKALNALLLAVFNAKASVSSVASFTKDALFFFRIYD